MCINTLSHNGNNMHIVYIFDSLFWRTIYTQVKDNENICGKLNIAQSIFFIINPLAALLGDLASIGGWISLLLYSLWFCLITYFLIPYSGFSDFSTKWVRLLADPGWSEIWSLKVPDLTYLVLIWTTLNPKLTKMHLNVLVSVPVENLLSLDWSIVSLCCSCFTIHIQCLLF